MIESWLLRPDKRDDMKIVASHRNCQIVLRMPGYFESLVILGGVVLDFVCMQQGTS